MAPLMRVSLILPHIETGRVAHMMEGNDCCLLARRLAEPLLYQRLKRAGVNTFGPVIVGA